MCRILLVEDAVPEAEALRTLIEQHPCAGAIQLESCSFFQVRKRISLGPRIDVLFAPVDAPGAFPTCDSDERAGIALVRELQDHDVLPLTVYCTTRCVHVGGIRHRSSVSAAGAVFAQRGAQRPGQAVRPARTSRG